MHCAPDHSLRALPGAPLDIEVWLDRWGDPRIVSVTPRRSGIATS